MENGGDVTLKTMQKLTRDDQQNILDYLRDCPLYETLTVKGRNYILVVVKHFCNKYG
jgi:serine/threonine protein phosphatase 1